MLLIVQFGKGTTKKIAQQEKKEKRISSMEVVHILQEKD